MRGCRGSGRHPRAADRMARRAAAHWRQARIPPVRGGIPVARHGEVRGWRAPRCGCRGGPVHRARGGRVMNFPRSRHQAERFGNQSGWRVAVVIPARNEQDRIRGCLDALAASLARARCPGGIVLVVNNTEDGTTAMARDWWGAHPDSPGILLDCTSPEDQAGVGWARRQGLDAASAQLPQDGILMTSDADARVDPGWVAANLAELTQADLICGTVRPMEAELSRLPDAFGRHGPREGAYMQAIVRLISTLDPQPHDPAPAHRNAAGASLAFSALLHADVGGMPCLPIREDRVFVGNAEARDWRIRYAGAPVVLASCRLTGRTGGGMAAALRARIEEDDPLCDELLEPARTALLRYGLKGQLRRSWPDGALVGVLAPHLPSGHDRGGHFGAFWRLVENALPGLRPVRLRQSDLPAQQKILNDWFAGQSPGRERT
ncbi:glycosyltransferase family 2 protein [Sinirhodobacter populi]|uniref:Glycosyltransferase family 2 protein n=2 Tax=Paenirhodobacter populi TaxID=2306993 RepID=A0A443IYT5_9RHOB|nr:glycosyltransferase family 2 protein [Sinirhodobacter populi]